MSYRPVRVFFLGAAVLAFSLLQPSQASSQTRKPLWEFGLAGTGNLLVGGASDFLDAGVGVQGFGARQVGESIWLRADVLYFGLDAEQLPSESADNAMLTFGIGPELGFGGNAVRGYVRGLVGLVANLQSRDNSSLARETSWAGVFGGGTGVRIRLGSGTSAPALDLGGDVLKTGNLAFARTALSQGTIEQDVVILSLRAGVTLLLD